MDVLPGTWAPLRVRCPVQAFREPSHGDIRKGTADEYLQAQSTEPSIGGMTPTRRVALAFLSFTILALMAGTTAPALAEDDPECEAHPWHCEQFQDFPDPEPLGGGSSDPWAFCTGSCSNPCKTTTCTSACNPGTLSQCNSCCSTVYSRTIATSGCFAQCRQNAATEKNACEGTCTADHN